MAQEKKMVWCMVRIFMLSRVGIVWQDKYFLKENGRSFEWQIVVQEISRK